MKCYIILGTFFDMGGGQLYTRNKVNYLKKHGWTVFLYTGRGGKLFINDMIEYKNNCFPALNYLPFYFKNKERNKVINKIVEDCKGTWEQIVIESHKQPMAIWGEMIAKAVNGKHLFLDLDEDFIRFETWYYPFLDFKHKRKELAGINKLSLAKMFKDFKEITDENNYHLVFPATNAIENVDNSVIDSAPLADLNFGCISRLDKDYLIPMINEIVEFSDSNQDKKISLFIVGGAKDKKYSDEILAIGEKAKNLTVYLLGYLSPIPKSLIDRVDVFIGTAASAVMSADAGKVTIAVDTMTCEPIGIMGINAYSTTFSDGSFEWKKLSDYLQYIIFDKSIELIESKMKSDQFMGIDIEKVLDEHMLFLENSADERAYYSFDSLGFRYSVEYAVIRAIGITNARKMKQILRK